MKEKGAINVSELTQQLINIMRNAGKTMLSAHNIENDSIYSKEGSANFVTVYDVKIQDMIIGEIKRFLRGGNSLRVSRSIRDTAYRVLKARESIEAEDREATIEEIASQLNIKERDVIYALDAISDPVSLFDPVYNKSGDTLLLMDQIGDETNTEENWTEHVALASAMEMLGEREKSILFLRYYEGKTQTEISKRVGLSQAQVSRLEKNALNEVRSMMEC